MLAIVDNEQNEQKLKSQMCFSGFCRQSTQLVCVSKVEKCSIQSKDKVAREIFTNTILLKAYSYEVLRKGRGESRT